MNITIPYFQRKAIGLTHRVFTLCGQTSSVPEVLNTIKLILPHKYYGEFVRLGGESDGAYVLPDALEGIVASISPGVSEEIEFDLELGRRGIYSYMFDASVSRPTRLTEMQFFEQRFIDTFESDITKTLDAITHEVYEKHPGDLLLQMDIEGAEYQCLNATETTTLEKFRIIVLEFHHLQDLLKNNLYCRYWIRPIFEKLNKNHKVVHVHANNYGKITEVQGIPIPDLLEVTYLRRDYGLNEDSSPQDGRHLDIRNRQDKPPLVLGSPWFDHQVE